jgi:hypothetical protein
MRTAYPTHRPRPLQAQTPRMPQAGLWRALGDPPTTGPNKSNGGCGEIRRKALLGTSGNTNGATPATNATIATVTFGNPWPNNKPPTCTISPGNFAAATTSLPFINLASTTTNLVVITSGPTALPASSGPLLYIIHAFGSL